MVKSRPPTDRQAAPVQLAEPTNARRTDIRSPASRGGANDAFFRHIVAGMRNGALALTRAGVLTLINDEAYRILEIAPGPRDLDRAVGDVLSDQPEVVRLLNSVFDLHQLPNRAELQLRPSGKVIGYTLGLVRDDAGAVVGASMFFKELTRVEQLEERERLRDRLAALGEMAAAIAHEVKNPLAAIEIMAGLLRRKLADTPDAQTVLTDIIKETKMANAIVQEALEFVRPIRLQVERTAVAEAVRAAVQLADTKAQRGDIGLDVDLPEALPPIQGDEYQLTQVFTNLLLNAYEAMEGTGHVAITAQTVRLALESGGRDAVVVEFADDGPGMPRDVADRVFNPFFTTNFTTKARGSGLGLAIVRRIVDAHDGSIDLKTAPGQGTLIRVTLPVRGNEEGK
jgi:signal transduction histidine kinase